MLLLLKNKFFYFTVFYASFCKIIIFWFTF